MLFKAPNTSRLRRLGRGCVLAAAAVTASVSLLAGAAPAQAQIDEATLTPEQIVEMVSTNDVFRSRWIDGVTMFGLTEEKANEVLDKWPELVLVTPITGQYGDKVYGCPDIFNAPCISKPAQFDTATEEQMVDESSLPGGQRSALDADLAAAAEDDAECTQQGCPYMSPESLDSQEATISVNKRYGTQCETTAPRNTLKIGGPGPLAPLKMYQYVAPEWCWNSYYEDVVRTDNQKTHEFGSFNPLIVFVRWRHWNATNEYDYHYQGRRLGSGDAVKDKGYFEECLIKPIDICPIQGHGNLRYYFHFDGTYHRAKEPRLN